MKKKFKIITVKDDFEFMEDDTDRLRLDGYEVIKYRGKYYDLRTGMGNLTKIKI